MFFRYFVVTSSAPVGSLTAQVEVDSKHDLDATFQARVKATEDVRCGNDSVAKIEIGGSLSIYYGETCDCPMRGTSVSEVVLVSWCTAI